MTEDSSKTISEKPLKAEDVLSFKEVGRPLQLDAVADEFHLMKGFLKNPLTPAVAQRVCEKSGTHLLKMVSPRADGEHACLYIEPKVANHRPKILPSVNAPDIPYCKVLYRPMEIFGRPSRSIVDDIMNPDEKSEKVLRAAASVFGQDVIDAAREALLDKSKSVTKLSAGEFPIIFVKRPNGSDLQITPVSPAPTFMVMKTVINALYERKKAAGLKMPYGAFENQSISSKPQNISGAIGGPRRRIVARMPPVLEQSAAEFHRYAHGGSFPRWRDADVADRVLRYAGMLDADETYNDKNTRAALDRTADRLIRDTQNFIYETVEEVDLVITELGIKGEELPKPPAVSVVIMRRRWPLDTFDQARKALTSSHFEHRIARLMDMEEGMPA